MDKVWFVTMHTGYCGSDAHDILVMPENATEDEVQNEAWQMAIENAASYGIYSPSEDWGEEEEDYEDEEMSENIEGYAVLYDPKLHDMYRCGGGSFMNDPVYKKADL